MLQQIQQFNTNGSSGPFAQFIYAPILKKYIGRTSGGNQFFMLNHDGTYSTSSSTPYNGVINIGYGKDVAGAQQIYAIIQYANSVYALFKVTSTNPSNLTLYPTPMATYSTTAILKGVLPIWVDEASNAIYGVENINGNNVTGVISKFNITTGTITTSYPHLPKLGVLDTFILDISDFNTFRIWESASNMIHEGKLSGNIAVSYPQNNTIRNLAWNGDMGFYRQQDINPTFNPTTSYIIRDYKPMQAVASITASRSDLSCQNSGFVLSIMAKDASNTPVPSTPVRTRVYGLNPMQTITSITRVGATATATCTAHGYVNNDVVYIPAVGQYLDQPTWGVNQIEYSGFVTVANATANTFDFTISGTPATPATGTNIIAARTAAPFGSISVAPISEAGKIFSNIAINVSPTTDITMTTDANGQINLTYVNSTTSTGTDVFKFDSL